MGGLPDSTVYRQSFPGPGLGVRCLGTMTATVENVPFDLLRHITARITAEVKGVNRVLFDLTPKPTGAIE